MAVMASPNGTRTVTCRIAYDSDALWAQVTNVDSKNTVTIDTEGIDRENIFSQEENALYDILTNGMNNRLQDLTIPEMRLIMAMANKADSARGPAKTIEVVEVRALPAAQQEQLTREGKGITQQAVQFAAAVTRQSNTKDNTGYLESQAKALQEVSEKDWDFISLTYDIADEAKEHDSPELNPTGLKWWLPCDLLWRHGYHHQLSQWVLIRDRYLTDPVIVELRRIWSVLNKIRGRKGKPLVVPTPRRLHPDEIAAIRQEASEALDALIRNTHTRLIESIDRADRQLKEALDIVGPMTEKEIRNAEDARNNTVRAKIREAIEDLDKAIASAEAFDEKEKKSDLFDGLRSAIRSHSAAFNAMAEQRKVKPAPTV